MTVEGIVGMIGPPMKRGIRVHVLLTEEEHKMALRLAASKGETLSGLLRRLVRAENDIDQNGRRRQKGSPPEVGAVKGTQRPPAARA